MPQTTYEKSSERKSLWNVLENPFVYRLSQAVLAPRAEERIIREVKKAVGPSLPAGRHLDIGCGPKSYLWQMGLAPIGIDLIHGYNIHFRKNGKAAITGSASALPFRDESFDTVWNFGLLHHLSDKIAIQALAEMLRVVRPGGRVFLFDGVLPRSAWRQPVMWTQRKLDRGRHMRKQEALEVLLVDRSRWRLQRFRYCFWGQEGIFGIYQKPYRHLEGNELGKKNA